MRILHLITRMDRGGSAVNTLISATAQVQAEHQVTLAVGSSIESDMNTDEQAAVDQGVQMFIQAGGQLVEVADLKRAVGWCDIKAWFQVRSILVQGFDILHTHTSKAGAIGRLAVNRKVHKMAVVHTPHGHVFHGYFGVLKSTLFRYIERILAIKTDALVALTQAERDDHLQLHIGTKEQWHVIASGVDISSITERIETIRGENNHRRWHAVSVGRLVSIKGMERLIRAWADVCQQKPEATLAIVGDGNQRASLEQLRDSLQLEHRIHFAGWCDPLPYLAAANSFVLLSHNEGMGRAVVEAFAAGLPCVVSDVCGLCELVDDQVGRCVDADQPQDVAAALLTDWQPDTRAAASQRAEYYSVEGMVNGLSKLYQQVSHD